MDHYLEENGRIRDYLLEKGAIGFVINPFMVLAGYDSEDTWEHRYITLPKYYNEILCDEIARLCCLGNITPCLYIHRVCSPWGKGEWLYYIIQMRPCAQLTAEHAPLMAEHMRSGSNVAWKPPSGGVDDG